MGATRKYYENLLKLFDKVCKTPSQNHKGLDSVKNQLQISIKKIQQFHLFDLPISEYFLNCINTPTLNFEIEQKNLAKELYVILGELLFTFETSNPRVDYAKVLELSRTELPFNIASNWNINENFDDSFSLKSLFFKLNNNWLNLRTEKEFNDYKLQLRAKRINRTKSSKDKRIPNHIYKKIKEYFTEKILSYRKFISDNYPEIKKEFNGYDSSIRVYIIPQKKNDDDIIHQVNFYKDYINNDLFIYPYYLDFVSTFSNLEEIENEIHSAYMGLFNELDIDKYGHQFSTKTIFHELHRIFITKASHTDLKDYLIYLLRGQTLRVNKTENENILKIENKKCKLYFQNIPTLEQLKTELNEDEKQFQYIAFKVRPDEETLKLIEENSIQYFILEYLGREQVNIDNGNMIHWFIKDRIKSIDYDLLKNDYSFGDNLLKRLENCPLGSKGWIQYENLCTEIFEFLFKDDFRNFSCRTQSYTHDKIFRRDLIINNNYKDSTGIWAQVKSEFNCNLIVVDFKNYSEVLEQNEFYLPSKYLNLVIGKFAIIFSRKGLGNSARILQRRMFNRDKELILCLDDNDLQSMIKEKMLGQDPTYRLENQKFLMYEFE